MGRAAFIVMNAGNPGAIRVPATPGRQVILICQPARHPLRQSAVVPGVVITPLKKKSVREMRRVERNFSAGTDKKNKTLRY